MPCIRIRGQSVCTSLGLDNNLQAIHPCSSTGIRTASLDDTVDYAVDVVAIHPIVRIVTMKLDVEVPSLNKMVIPAHKMSVFVGSLCGVDCGEYVIVALRWLSLSVAVLREAREWVAEDTPHH